MKFSHENKSKNTNSYCLVYPSPSPKSGFINRVFLLIIAKSYNFMYVLYIFVIVENIKSKESNLPKIKFGSYSYDKMLPDYLFYNFC
jgi:hypothetical protein